MSNTAPSVIVIESDDYHAEYVGRTSDGRQFFFTTPFVPANPPDPGREFLALYLFDAEGKLLEARIDDLGTRAGLDKDHVRQLHDQRLGELGQVKLARIKVKPFRIERFGVAFGLVPEPPEQDVEDDHWWVIVQPGDYMAFTPPWGGRYDT